MNGRIMRVSVQEPWWRNAGREQGSGAVAAAASGAAGGEAVQEADEVVDVEDGRGVAVVAVGVAVARGKLVEETDEVVDVEDRCDVAAIAVGIAGGNRHGPHALEPVPTADTDEVRLPGGGREDHVRMGAAGVVVAGDHQAAGRGAGSAIDGDVRVIVGVAEADAGAAAGGGRVAVPDVGFDPG